MTCVKKMKKTCGRLVMALVAMTGVVPMVGCSGQTQTAMGEFPRTADGTPDLSGVWQAFTTAAWNLQDHNAEKGVPGGQGVVEGGEIPYQPWAATQKAENYENRMTADPLSNCYLSRCPTHYLPAAPV